MSFELGIFASILGIEASTLGFISFGLNQIPLPAAELGIFASILGIEASMLGFLSFALNQLPQPIFTHSVMRVAVGMNGNGFAESEGEEPDIRLWNDFGEFLGMNLGDKETITDGHFKDIYIGENGQQPTYALLTANSNAICITYLALVWPDDAKYGWVGNWGYTCGRQWSVDHHNFMKHFI